MVVAAMAVACISLDTGIAGQKKTVKRSQSAQHRKVPHKRKKRLMKSIVARPAVLDTTCIDTMAAVRRSMMAEINRWSSARYRHGGMSVKGIDCSGFTYKVFRNALNYTLPRTSRAQALLGEEIDRDNLEFGDLLFFYSKSKGKRKRINHVGIYVGDGNFVHSYKRHGVGMNSLDNSYYATHFAFAKRVDPLAMETTSNEE